MQGARGGTGRTQAGRGHWQRPPQGKTAKSGDGDGQTRGGGCKKIRLSYEGRDRKTGI